MDRNNKTLRVPVSKFNVFSRLLTLNFEPGTLNRDVRRKQERSHAYL